MLKVLVVEDEKYLRDILINALKYFGLKVCTACNKFDALKIIKKQNFNFILLDHFLPGDAPANWNKIIKNISLKKPVIIMSGLSQNQNKHIDINHFAYLNKPFGLKEVAHLVDKIRGLGA